MPDPWVEDHGRFVPLELVDGARGRITAWTARRRLPVTYDAGPGRNPRSRGRRARRPLRRARSALRCGRRTASAWPCGRWCPGAAAVRVLPADAPPTPMERLHPAGFFETVLPDRRDLFAYRLEVTHDGHITRDRGPVPLPVAAKRLRPPPSGRGHALPRLREARCASGRARRGDRRRLRGVGAERLGVSASWAISTTGTAGAIRCVFIPPTASGRFSCRGWSRATATSSRSAGPPCSRSR